ncbi:MAG: putative sigma-54 modulation protein [Candidatus Poriferisodalaceae bacterium]
MDITITGRKVKVSHAVRDAVERKIGTLDRFVSDLDRAEVVFREDKNPRISDKDHVEITMFGHGHQVRATSAASDQHQAIDLAVDKLGKQLRKLKTRVARQQRPNLQREENHHPLATLEYKTDEEPDDDEREPQIVRRKTFDLDLMNPTDAVTRMGFLEHDFFLFINADSGKPSVVYLREDGDAGLIEIDT